MSTVDTLELTEAVDAVRAAAEVALANESAEEFERIERQIGELEGLVREMQQSLWQREVKAAIRQLEGSQPLGDADKQAIRAFLISDALSYLQHENNFGDWADELTRLLGDVSQRVKKIDRTSVADLRGVLKDAQRLLPDIRNYLDERRRVELFEEALDKLDGAARKTLVRLLREQLDSARA